jgi:hypothetical protein
MCCCTIILLLPLYNNTATAILTWFHKNSLVFTGFCYWHTDLVSQKKPSCLDVTWGRNIGKSIHSQVLFISQLVSRHQVLLKSENWFLSGQNWWWSCVSKPQKLDQKNVGKYSFWLLLCTFVYFFQATPRLSEDKVKQCVDPRLKGEYPPKGVAKVDILPPGTRLCEWCFTLIWPSFIDVILGLSLQLAAVAALCVQYEAEFRPNMSIVVKALSPLLQQRPAPATAEPAPQPVSWNQSHVMGPSAYIQSAHSMSHWEYFGYLFCSILSWVQHTWTCPYCFWTTVRGLMLAPHNGICSRLEVVFYLLYQYQLFVGFRIGCLKNRCRMIWTFFCAFGVALLPCLPCWLSCTSSRITIHFCFVVS